MEPRVAYFMQSFVTAYIILVMFCYKYLSKNFSILLFLVLYMIKQIQTTLYHNYN